MDDSEECIRSAISRQYYGLFGVIRRYFININYKNELKSRHEDVHGKVFDELKKSNDDAAKEVLKVFNKLCVARNHADYDDQLDAVHFKKFLR